MRAVSGDSDFLRQLQRLELRFARLDHCGVRAQPIERSNSQSVSTLIASTVVQGVATLKTLLGSHVRGEPGGWSGRGEINHLLPQISVTTLKQLGVSAQDDLGYAEGHILIVNDQAGVPIAGNGPEGSCELCPPYRLPTWDGPTGVQPFARPVTPSGGPSCHTQTRIARMTS